MKLAPIFASLLLVSACACAEDLVIAPPNEMEGDEFEITLFHESASEGENGSSSSSSGSHAYVEKVVHVGPNGIERIFDLTLAPDDEQRLINWYFPVRILESADGSIQILNRGELEQRRDKWLSAAEIPSEACGTWYFTWNAFQVECDPDAIVETIRAIKIQPPRLAIGEPIEHPAAIELGRLQEGNAESDALTYVARMHVDPDYFHRSAAQSDVVVGQIIKEPISFDDAYQKRKSEEIEGTIEIAFHGNPSGRIWRRTTLIETDKRDTQGELEHTVSKETVERKPLKNR